MSFGYLRLGQGSCFVEEICRWQDGVDRDWRLEKTGGSSVAIRTWYLHDHLWSFKWSGEFRVDFPWNSISQCGQTMLSSQFSKTFASNLLSNIAKYRGFQWVVSSNNGTWPCDVRTNPGAKQPLWGRASKAAGCTAAGGRGWWFFRGHAEKQGQEGFVSLLIPNLGSLSSFNQFNHV